MTLSRVIPMLGLPVLISCGADRPKPLSDPNPTPIRFVRFDADAEWAAYQLGDGPWQRLAPTQVDGTRYEFDVVGDGRYSIAYKRRFDFNVVHATHDELPVVPIGLEPTENLVNVTPVGFGPDIRWLLLSVGPSGTLRVGTSFPWPLPVNVQPGVHDMLVATTTDVDGFVPTGYWLFRDRPVTATQPLKLDVSEEPLLAFERHFEVQGGRPSTVRLWTANGLRANLGSASWYPMYGGHRDGDRYVFRANGTNVTAFHVEVATKGVLDIAIDLDAITPLDGVTVTSSLDAHGLDYAPSPSSPPVVGHSFYVTVTNGLHFADVHVRMSAAWMSADQTDYEFPDFSKVNGFDIDWLPYPGDKAAFQATTYMGEFHQRGEVDQHIVVQTGLVEQP